MDHEKYMRLALIEAKKAAAAGEIPVGAVVVCGNTVLAAARNDREVTHSPLGHAEVRAIEMACQARGDWRLDPVCHTGTLPHVQWSDPERAGGAGGVWCRRPTIRLPWLPVKSCTP